MQSSARVMAALNSFGDIVLKETKIEHPYLGKLSSNAYVSALGNVIETLSIHLTQSEINALKKKLQLTTKNFNEPQYLQTACELSVCAYFAEKFSQGFKYEDKVNPPKDVDCSVYHDYAKYNIEVKCATFSDDEKLKSEDCFRMSAIGRMEEYPDLIEKLSDVFSTSPSGKPLKVYKHKDNNLKDFLISAHEKFSDEVYCDIVNILWVCCDDPMDMTKWTGYLTGLNGLFTSDSFVDRNLYSKVDVVVLSNLYHRHAKYQTKKNLENYWSVDSSFNIMFCNPGRLSNKEIAIKKFYEIVPNFCKEVMDYDAPDPLKLSAFVVHELKGKGLYYFD
ncbi:hypothetical protein [Aliivibrio fischeri]|nr:hypothetical protein [Aliivibrio fischeri]